MNFTVEAEKNQEPDGQPFGDLMIGTAFTHNGRLVWLKTDYDGAVDIADGQKSPFKTDEKVFLIKAKVIWGYL